MDQAINEPAFCEIVVDTLGTVLTEKGFAFTESEQLNSTTLCHFRGYQADLQFVYKPRDGEVNCLIRYPKPGSHDEWVYLTQHIPYDAEMTDEEWAEATDVGSELKDKVAFYEPLLQKLPTEK